MKQFTVRREDHLEVSLWLAFDSSGGVAMTRRQPLLSRDERAMALTVKVPLALFNTPQLRATISIDAPAVAAIQIDATAAAEALRSALGCDIDVRVTHQGEGE